MKKKYYLYTTAIIALLLVFVFVNEYRNDYYTLSVEEAHELLEKSEINVSEQQILSESQALLRVNIKLAVDDKGVCTITENKVTISIERLLDRKFIKQLKKHDGMIVLEADNPALAVNAWLMLTRKGVTNIKLLDYKKNEELHYTFTAEKK